MPPFDLRECMEATLAVAAATDTKGIELLGHLDDGCPRRVLGDVTRLRQVLVNLVGNAVKFTEAGHVLLTIEPDPDPRPGERGDRLRFSVSDTGIGIPADRLGILFDSYTPGRFVDHPAARRHRPGTGDQRPVGPGHGRHLPRREHGRRRAARSVSRSPWPPPPDLARPAIRTRCTRLEGQRALVVDDSSTNRRILRHQLEAWGMQVSDVGSGAQALEIVESGRWLRRGAGGHEDAPDDR